MLFQTDPCNVDGVHYPPSICPPNQTTQPPAPAPGTAATGADVQVWMVGMPVLLGAAVVAASISRWKDRRRDG